MNCGVAVTTCRMKLSESDCDGTVARIFDVHECLIKVLFRRGRALVKIGHI